MSLPVFAPPNAVVYGSGTSPTTRTVRSGISFDTIVLIVLLIMARLVGFV